MTDLRLVTYNVRGCVGMDGIRSVDRVAEVVQACRPDVVALQELFVEGPVGGHADQPSELARRLGMDCVFTATVTRDGQRYGHALLARLPVRLLRHGLLPTLANRPLLERRAALWAAVHVGERRMHILTTHLGLDRRERMGQIQSLLGAEWVGAHSRSEPMILCGDFNSLPWSRAYRRLTRCFRDVQRAAGWRGVRATFPAVWPLLRLDHVFVSRGVGVHSVDVPATPLARRASDHRPVVVTLSISEQEVGV